MVQDVWYQHKSTWFWLIQKNIPIFSGTVPLRRFRWQQYKVFALGQRALIIVNGAEIVLLWRMVLNVMIDYISGINPKSKNDFTFFNQSLQGGPSNGPVIGSHTFKVLFWFSYPSSNFKIWRMTFSTYKCGYISILPSVCSNFTFPRWRKWPPPQRHHPGICNWSW